MTNRLLARRKTYVLLFAGVLVLVSFAAVGIIRVSGRDGSTASIGGLRPALAETRAFVMHETPRPIPEFGFDNADGQPLTMADFRGKVVLLNIWATWCAPCREEMPTLDALQVTLGGAEFQVVPLSIDRAGPNVVRKFYDEIGIRHLGLYIDSSSQASFALSVVGLPTTLLIDVEGREVGRLIGPAEWDSNEMISLFKSQLTKY